MINNYYAGPYCKKFEQHLAEIQQEIRTLMEKIKLVVLLAVSSLQK